MILLWDITKEKTKKLNYRIEEWNTSTPYDIFQNQPTYPTVCFFLDTWHRNDHCITVCGKLIFDYNLKEALPLKQDCLNYPCCGNDTNKNKCFGVLHAIIAVSTEVVQIILNMK